MTTGVKAVVIYPRPVDPSAFEAAYQDEHVPMVEQKLKGLTRLVLTKVQGSPQGNVTVYRLAELHFASLADLNQCLQSADGQEVVAHARQISTGGPPILLICDEESYVFW